MPRGAIPAYQLPSWTLTFVLQAQESMREAGGKISEKASQADRSAKSQAGAFAA